MRKPMLQAVLLAFLALAGIWAMLHAVDVPYAYEVPAARQPARIWALAGFLVTAFSTWFAIRAWMIARLRSALIDSHDGLARWTARSSDGSDMPVVIGQEAVVVGDACTPIPTGFSLLTYTRLGSVDWIEGPPGTGGILLLGRIFVGRSKYIHFVRVPVPEGARAHAQVAIDGLLALTPDENREKAELRFEAELAAARGDPGGEALLRTKRLLTWGFNMALFSGGTFAVLYFLPASSGAPAFLAPVAAGLCIAGIGMMVTGVLQSR